MLNSESKLVSTAIWLAITGFIVQFFWSLFAWPAPATVLQHIHDSELAAFANRNQTALATLLGLGGLALAYVLNGWRDRTERRHVIERAERRTAEVLAREAGELAATCETAARQLVTRGAQTAPIIAGLRTSVAMRDHMLLAAPAQDFARLGAGASAAARSTRSAISRLVEAVDASTREEAGAPPGIATRAVEASFAAREASRIFAAVAKSGPPAADRLRLIPVDAAAIERVLGASDDAAKPSRLQPAA